MSDYKFIFWWDWDLIWFWLQLYIDIKWEVELFKIFIIFFVSVLVFLLIDIVVKFFKKKFLKFLKNVYLSQIQMSINRNKLVFSELYKIVLLKCIQNKIRIERKKK